MVNYYKQNYDEILKYDNTATEYIVFKNYFEKNYFKFLPSKKTASILEK